MENKFLNFLLRFFLVIGLIFTFTTKIFASGDINIRFSASDIDGKNLIDGNYNIDRSESVLDITKRLFDENSISYTASEDEILEIKNHHVDTNEQWIFVVNGQEMGSEGASNYYLKDGDKLEWIHIEIHLDVDSGGRNIPYIAGYSDGTFRPYDYLTREEAASVFFNILDVEMREAFRTSDHGYEDLESGRWSEEEIATLGKLELMHGYKDGKFKPDKYITRGELAVTLARINNLTDDEDLGFTDIENYWGKKKINMVANKGWINGYPDKSFRPMEGITRAEFTSTINKSLGRNKESVDIKNLKNTFTDVDHEGWFYLDILMATMDF